MKFEKKSGDRKGSTIPDILSNLVPQMDRPTGLYIEYRSSRLELYNLNTNLSWLRHYIRYMDKPTDLSIEATGWNFKV